VDLLTESGVGERLRREAIVRDGAVIFTPNAQ
jgi:hypothetical protein